MYFEIIRNGKLIATGSEIINNFNIHCELMTIPTTRIRLPIMYREFISGREEFILYFSDKVLHALVTAVRVDKIREEIIVNLSHVIHEWRYRQISVNNAVKDKNINIVFTEEGSKGQQSVEDQLIEIYNDKNFAYAGWEINFSDKAKTEQIDYVYSRQDKLNALNKTLELTDDLFWRVRLRKGRSLDISEFGEKKQYRLSLAPSGVNNIRIIQEPEIDYRFENVINLASVYSSKSDGGMNSMTLREVYNDKSLQKDGFPVVILRSDVNNERDYSRYSTPFPEIAPNNELEYAIIDEESVALENGYLIEGTYAFDDLAPFNIDPTETRQVTNADRKKAAVKCYHAGIRKLIQARRKFRTVVYTEELPADVHVGDQILLDYDNSVYVVGECTPYMRKIMELHDWYYLTQVDYYINKGEAIFCRLVLEKYLYTDRKTRNE